MNEYTDYLFAMPSFMSGVGRALDLGGTFDEYNFAETPEETDTIALYTDWCAIGQDMRDAMGMFETELDRDAG